jgi:ADP-heptose:LPS heptosyltransferase
MVRAQKDPTLSQADWLERQVHRPPGRFPVVKTKLLVIELWGLGDLVIATPFLQAASRHYEVTLLAKPYAQDLRERLWPEVQVRSFIAPWTAFRRKYAVHTWPWLNLLRTRQELAHRFAVGLSARWDPRDHFLLWGIGARQRLGFPRTRSQWFLTDPQPLPPPGSHRYENWRILAQAIGLELPARERLAVPTRPVHGEVLVHTGAGQPVRVWPLERYARIIAALRQRGYTVRVACDPDQRGWWMEAGEDTVVIPRSVRELLALLDRTAAFIGNDSGPSHLAAYCGVPTLTIFGPQLPDFFAPLHPDGEVIEGKPCPYKPCSDYCRFAQAVCMTELQEAEVWQRTWNFIQKVVPAPVAR